MLLTTESVLSLKEKTTQHWFSCFQIASFMADLFNIIFDDFGI